MINFQIFLMGLLVVSTLTGLCTEAVKSVLEEYEKPYRANTLAGVIALILSLAVGISYVLVSEIAFTTPIIITLVALVLMSWLCAMVGYDKVIQAISQFKAYRKSDNK